MKRIIICCDGTWNTPDKQEDGIPIATNVVKVAQAVREKDAKDIKQLMYYDPGVGTSGNWFKRLYDGATGAGLMRNILEAYRFLIHNYEKGDELFFFGFSRGAFTVRSLGGLIRNSGILLPRHIYMLGQAFKLYRAGRKSTHPKEKEATLFRRTYSVSDITPVKFIGVWDTVGALGNPLLLNIIRVRGNQFHDTDLSSTVECAYQALAIDEKRRQFKATLWHQQPGTGEQRQKRGQEQKQTLEQLWFVGVHSNVGGGYSTTGLSDLALEWMCAKAQQDGLELQLEPPQPKPDVEEKVRESRSWIYPLSWLFPAYRPIAKLDLELDPKKRKQTNESLHPSVFERYRKDSSYRPRNLEDYFKRFPDLKLD
jgi:uncharacterized protein (DUF2235 family)